MKSNLFPLPPLVVLEMTLAAISCFTASSAEGQAITVQQPVVSRFNVQTVVSVPDRGSVLLGSVSTSESFSRRRGPFNVGSNIGRGQTHRSVWASVTIHDFEALDAALLAKGDRLAARRAQPSPPLTGMAARAAEQLLHPR